jgi:hypothetical protein
MKEDYGCINRERRKYKLERSSSCRQEESVNWEGNRKGEENKWFKTEY